MSFAVAAGYGIAICVATVTLILLPLMARPLAVAPIEPSPHNGGKAAPSNPTFFW